MNPELQRRLIARVLAHIAAGTTDMAPEERRVGVERYLSDTHFAEEQTQLFGRLPLILAASTALPEPGDFLRLDRYGMPLLLTRTADGEVHAFLNACTHRGARLVDEAHGCGKSAFSCPYHGWVYGNDGQLLHMTRAECFTDTDTAGRALVALPVQERHGLIWGTLTPGGSLDVGGFLGDMAADLDWLELDSHLAYRPFEFHCRANWKVLLEGFQEQYHLPYAHPQEVSSYYPDVLVGDRLGLHLRMTTARQAMRRLAGTDPSRWRLRSCASVGYYLCPNTMLLAHPDHVALVRVYPVTVDSCTVQWVMLIPRAASDPTWHAHWERARASHHDTFAEDVVIGEGIYAGMRQNAVTEQVIGRNELGIMGCMDSLDTAMAKAAPPQ